MTSPVAAMGATDVPAAAAGRDGGDGGRRGAAERRRRWSRFRPCIDLHDGHVKQIVGGTLTDAGDTLLTNFVAAYMPDGAACCAHQLGRLTRLYARVGGPCGYSEDAAYFGRLYREHALEGAHVIKLGPNNDAAARQALAAWPGRRSKNGPKSLRQRGLLTHRSCRPPCIPCHRWAPNRRRHRRQQRCRMDPSRGGQGGAPT